MADPSTVRNLRSPLTGDQLRPLDPGCRLLQIGEPMTRRELERIAAFAGGYPDVELRVYGQRTVEDLEFLELFPTLLRFTIEVFELESLEGLRHLRPDLRHLGLGRTRSRAHSLGVLERFTGLRSLWIEGHGKDFEAVGAADSLERLSLRSVTLPDLTTLTRLRRLKAFELKLGGTRDLGALPGMGSIEYLEIWLVRGLADLTPIAGLEHLRYLFLQALKGVETLPSLASLTDLRRVHLEAMKGLEDLRAVADAPCLEQLLLVDMRHLEPDALRPFVGHPHLRAATLGLGSDRKNDAARELLGLPETSLPADQLGLGWWEERTGAR